MSRIDELFSGDAPPPPLPDRQRLIRGLLWVAAPLNLLGPLIWTSVPGAFLSIYAWYVADGEIARVESGALPPERRAPLTRLRNTAFGFLGFCVLSLTLQILLFGASFVS